MKETGRNTAMEEHVARADDMLAVRGVKPTSNRILVVRTLMEAECPLSLAQLEERIVTLERSSIFRVLSLLREQEVIHDVEDGRGIVKYELCHGHGHCSVADMHVHFYCEECGRVFCFEEAEVPVAEVREGFEVKGVNYMLKGLCPTCLRSQSR